MSGTDKEYNSKLYLQTFLKNIGDPIKEGILGFAIILVLILTIKIILFTLGKNKELSPDILDFILAVSGFFLQFTGSILKKYNAERNKIFEE